MSDSNDKRKLRAELASFAGLWQGGFLNHIDAPQIRDLRQVWDVCVAPYAPGARVLEIGPGRGAWTRRMLDVGAKHVYCLDALSARHNGFWKYVGRRDAARVTYRRVTDFECSDVPAQSIDFLFSFDAFCHISYTGMRHYFSSFRRALRSGAAGFVMIADAEKHEALRQRGGERFRPAPDADDIRSYDGPPAPGRWYWVGRRRCHELLVSLGYEVIASDVDACARDAICHFVWNG